LRDPRGLASHGRGGSVKKLQSERMYLSNVVLAGKSRFLWNFIPRVLTKHFHPSQSTRVKHEGGQDTGLSCHRAKRGELCKGEATVCVTSVGVNYFNNQFIYSPTSQQYGQLVNPRHHMQPIWHYKIIVI
jgi:hypothetical protein